MLEENSAQIIFDPPAEAIHEMPHSIAHHAREHRSADDSSGDLPYESLRTAFSHGIDADAEQPWNDAAQARGYDYKDKPDAELPPIWAEEWEEASELFHRWHTDCP